MKCDAKAFAGMYKTVYKDLYRFALCMMKNSHDAEDAVSDAVVSAYEHITSLRDETAFKSWIFTILANTCKKRLRKLSDLQEREIPSVFTEETSDREVDYGLALDVRNAFAVLTEEEQEIIGLSVFGGYQSKEIGELLDLNANTVRSKRSRALEKMGAVLR